MLSGKPSIFYVPFNIQKLAFVTVCFPLFGFITCIIMTYLRNFQSSTRTHCDVSNVAPSISASIGSYIPQKYIWQSCIAFHAAPRFLFAYLYKQYFFERLSFARHTRCLVQSNFLLNVIENFALIGLSFISSRERFEVHKFCFGTFIFCSSVYMCLTYYLLTRCGFMPQTRLEIQSIRYKKSILKAYFFCIPLLVYFYYRHNEYCEPYVYSVFCFLEYIIVLSNMSYHMTAYYDLAEVTVVLPKRGPQHDYSKEVVPLTYSM